MRVASSSSVVLVALALAGCNEVEVPPFPAGQGQKAMATTYPPGPYGSTQGQIVPDYSFQGFYAPQTNADSSALQPITLGDFYDPSGRDTYAAGSPYGAGNPKPKALLIDIGATWCQPCQYEAKVILPPEYQKDHPLGAEFLFVLADGPTQGVSAAPSDLTNWVTKFKTSWPSGLDPDRKLVSMFGAAAFPVNILVDPRTMKVVDVKQGEVDQPFLDELTALLSK